MAGRFKEEHRKVNKEAKRRYKGDRKMDAALGGAMDSVMGDLTSTYKGQRGKLTRSNERVMTRILALNARSKQANNRNLDSMENYFAEMGGGPNNAMTGGTMGGRYDILGDLPRREARADAKLGRAEVQYGKDLSQSAKDTMGVLGGMVEGMGEASEYLVARTNSERARATATEVAAMHHEISMAKLDFQNQQKAARLQSKLDRRNMAYQQKVLEGDVGPPGQQALAAADFLASSTESIMAMYNKGQMEGGTPVSAADIANLLYIQGGESLEPSDKKALQSLAQRLIDASQASDNNSVNNNQRTQAVQDVLRTVPEWAEANNHKSLTNYVSSYFDDIANTRKAEGKEDDESAPVGQGTNYKKNLQDLQKADEATSETSPGLRDLQYQAVYGRLKQLLHAKFPDDNDARIADLAQWITYRGHTTGPFGLTGDVPEGMQALVSGWVSSKKLPDLEYRTSR